MSNYAKQSDLENATGADILNFAKEVDLANLKSDTDKLDTDKSDINKLEKVPSGLKSLTNRYRCG